MIESTKDILYITSSVAIVWIAFFVCWFLYNLTKALRGINALIGDAQKKLSALDFFVTSLRARIEASLSAVGVASEVLQQAYLFAKDHLSKKPSRKKNKEG